MKYEERTMLGAAAGPSPVPEQPGLTKQSTGSHLRPSLQEHDIQEIFPRTNSLTSPGEWKGERERLDELLRRDRGQNRRTAGMFPTLDLAKADKMRDLLRGRKSENQAVNAQLRTETREIFGNDNAARRIQTRQVSAVLHPELAAVDNNSPEVMPMQLRLSLPLDVLERCTRTSYKRTTSRILLAYLPRNAAPGEILHRSEFLPRLPKV